jgi:hypothetical protein
MKCTICGTAEPVKEQRFVLARQTASQSWWVGDWHHTASTYTFVRPFAFYACLACLEAERRKRRTLLRYSRVVGILLLAISIPLLPVAKSNTMVNILVAGALLGFTTFICTLNDYAARDNIWREFWSSFAYKYQQKQTAVTGVIHKYYTEQYWQEQTRPDVEQPETRPAAIVPAIVLVLAGIVLLVLFGIVSYYLEYFNLLIALLVALFAFALMAVAVGELWLGRKNGFNWWHRQHPARFVARRQAEVKRGGILNID